MTMKIIKGKEKKSRRSDDEKKIKRSKDIDLLDDRLRDVLRDSMKITALTPVQIQSLRNGILQRADPVVQAPTGSGKTLAYVLQIAQFLIKNAPKNQHEILALILVPNRELATQVQNVIDPIAKALGLSSISFVPSKDRTLKHDQEKFSEYGGNIVVATPGRLTELIELKNDTTKCVKNMLRNVEILIGDEVDRLLDQQFRPCLSKIVGVIPSQRRTGLYSATYVEAMKLEAFKIRNIVRIKCGAADCTPCVEYNDTAMVTTQNDGDENLKPEIPTNLNNYYTIVPADSKLSHLISFLKQRTSEKILVFVSSYQCSDYLAQCLKHVWQAGANRIQTLHGKTKKRDAVLTKFRQASSKQNPAKPDVKLRENEENLTCKTKSSKKKPKKELPHSNTILIATDLMARGIDVPDIDWVLQYDVPRQSAWFIHRSGRSARCGRNGDALVFLMPSEQSYVNYLEKHENVNIRMLPIEVPENSTQSTHQKLQNRAQKDRAFLELGTRAYVSYIQAYVKHDCQLICSMQDLDVVGVANDYGLLRLPKMPELANRDLKEFKGRKDVNTADIPYRNEALEKKRKQDVEERRKKTHLQKKQKAKDQRKQEEGKKRKRKLDDADSTVDDWAADLKLMKRLKKGRISQKDFDAQFGM